MKITKLHLQNFRNIELQHLEFHGNHQFFLAPNGQGKTNILESIHFLSALKSFRAPTISPLIKEDQLQAQIYAEIDENTILITLQNGKKSLTLNDTKIHKATDYIGKFPSVVLAADDILLLRGSPSHRRRFLDQTLASIHHEYYTALKNYSQTLQQRNALLKSSDFNLLPPYDQLLHKYASILITFRLNALPVLNQLLVTAYNQIATESESPQIQYLPNTTNLEQSLIDNLPKDRAIKSTSSGPHRDDFSIELLSHSAKLYASEGQQRALTIALKLAQFQYFHQQSHTLPLLLADDILGQLDPARAENFWNAIPQNTQVLATGTVLPSTNHTWETFAVNSGSINPQRSCDKLQPSCDTSYRN